MEVVTFEKEDNIIQTNFDLIQILQLFEKIVYVPCSVDNRGLTGYINFKLCSNC